MTSQQFSANKKAAAYDFRFALKKIIIPTVLTFLSSLILFVIAPLSTVFSYYFDSNMNIERLRKEVVLALTGMDIYSGEYVGIYFLLLGVLFAIISFSFITSKKAVNVFFSTSVDRRTLYKNRALAGILMIVLSTAIPIIIDMIINIVFLGNAGYVIKCALALFATTFVYIFTGFAIMSVAMVLCSTIIESLFFGAVAVGAPSVAVYFIDIFCRVFLTGYNHNNLFSYYDSEQFTQPSLFHYTSIINPLLIGKAYGAEYSIRENIFNFVYRVNQNMEQWSMNTANRGYKELNFDYILPIIVWAAISVCFIFIARSLFIKIKAENAGVHGASVFAQRFFAVICIIAACAFWVDTVSFVYSDLSLTANIAITVLVAVFIMIGMYFFIISICRRTIKHKAKELVIPFSAVCGVVVFTCILSAGAFGYSTYVPEVDKIDKAIITTNVINATASEFDNVPSKDSYYDDIFPNYYSGNSAIGVFDDEADLKLFTDINKELVEKTDNMTGNSVCVYYKLKNGKIVSRFYENTDYDASYRILSLRDSKAVRDELTCLLTGNVNDAPMSQKTYDLLFDTSTLFGYSDEKSAAYVLQGGRIYAVASNGMINGNLIRNTLELRQALLADLLSQTYEQRYKPSEAAIGGLFFSSCEYNEDNYDDRAETLLRNELGADVYESGYEGGYYIYPSMTNTINYLKSTGEYDLFLPHEDEIISISIEKCSVVRDTQFELWGSNAMVSHQFVTSNQFYTNVYYNEEDDFEQYYEQYNNRYYNIMMTDYFKNGINVNDSDEIAELMVRSRNYYFANEDDYIIMVHYKNSGYVSRMIPAEEIPEWVFNNHNF
ncbi:MAG: hypothetical protein K2H13_07135 [Eubacterium sp.]|nr:hypothetical protein [Eubacterium sp.]